MKTKILILRLLTIFHLLLLITCKDREITNPFDAACPKEVFTPSDFKAEQKGAAVQLTWKQANTNISGFVINRNENDGTMTEVAKIDKSFSQWSDENIGTDKKYGYQLFAYAGENLSNMLVTYFTPVNKTVVGTDAVSSITSTSAVFSGSATNDSGLSITSRGVCYGTNLNPTTADIKAEMGSGSGAFNLSVTGLKAGTTYYARAYAITKQGTTYGSQVTFTTSFLAVSQSSYTLPKESGSKVITVDSNIDWQAASNQSWCTLTATSGKANGSITVTVTENKEVPQRTAIVTFTGSGVTSQTVTLTQAGTEPPALTITPANQNVTNTTGTTTFAIISNVAWTASIDQSWCKISSTSGTGNSTLTVAYEANTSNSQRIANLAITGLGLSVKTITVTQAALISKTWNNVSDFLKTKNPNGLWSYGRKWSENVDGFDLLTTDSDGYWWMGNYGNGSPAISGGVAMWAKNNSNGLPCLRWTCPEDGTYNILANFIGADSRGVDVIIYITKNGTIIYSDFIKSDKEKKEFSNNSTTLNKSDRIDFLIKWNGGVYSEYSWTSVNVTISK